MKNKNRKQKRKERQDKRTELNTGKSTTSFIMCVRDSIREKKTQSIFFGMVGSVFVESCRVDITNSKNKLCDTVFVCIQEGRKRNKTKEGNNNTTKCIYIHK